MAKLGIKCVLYRNTATYGSPTWNAIACVKDLTVNPAWDEADGSTRASRVKLSAKTLMGLEISGTVKADYTDEDYAVLLDALNSDDVLDLMVLNGPSTENDVTGYRADFQVFSGSQDQASGAIVFDSIVLKPTVSANVPKQVVVATGAPTFSDIG